jgi:hypothetical protein
LPVEAAKDLLGERGSGRRHRRGALADRRLGSHLAARVERLAEEPVEQRTCRPDLVRKPHLAEDLAFAGNERVEPGGDAEQVVRRRPVAKPVKRGLDLGLQRREHLDCVPLRFLRIGGGDVQLCAVAGREADSLTLFPGQPSRERFRILSAECDLLAQLDRRVVVRGADEDEAQHQAKWVAGKASRTTTTRAKPARAR